MLEETLIRSLRELYDAEHRLIDRLPLVSDAINWQPARTALRREFTRAFRRLTGLEQALATIGAEQRREPCNATKLLERDLTVATTEVDPRVRLVQLLGRVRALLEYSQSEYRTSTLLADSIGRPAVSQILRDLSRNIAPNVESLDTLLVHAARGDALN